jgi:hypothetical protein
VVIQVRDPLVLVPLEIAHLWYKYASVKVKELSLNGRSQERVGRSFCLASFTEPRRTLIVGDKGSADWMSH